MRELAIVVGVVVLASGLARLLDRAGESSVELAIRLHGSMPTAEEHSEAFHHFLATMPTEERFQRQDDLIVAREQQSQRSESRAPGFGSLPQR